MPQPLYSKPKALFLHTINFNVKLCFIVGLMFFISINSFAQQKKTYNLLWRISGKGITKPSYLFGTMHVKDARAFRFSDSVMLALQNCSAFALEVHPDTMMKAVFDNLEKYDSTRAIKSLLTKEQYDVLAKRFEDKHGYSIEQVNPLSVEAMLKPETTKPGDKKTFVDAYLYGIARTFNKNIYGLENANDQINEIYGSTNELKEKLEALLDKDENSAKDSYEDRMVNIYNTGNLDAILDFINSDNSVDDLITRNRVMVRSILSILADQNAFVAVGAAHLPGEKGLISLLRKEGYTLTPVDANFTGIADKYTIDYYKMKWETYTDAEKGFSVETPGIAIKTDTFGGLNTVIYPDMTNDVYYGVYAIQKGAADKQLNTNEVIKTVLGNYRKNPVNKIISQKSFVENDLPVTDITLQNGSGYLRLQFIVKNSFLYCLYLGHKLEDLNQPYADRFFKSFKSFAPGNNTGPQWIDFENPAAAFKVRLPAKPELITKEVPSPSKKVSAPFIINMYTAQDKFSYTSYLIRYNDYPSGNYIANKDEFLEALAKDFSTKGKLIGKPVKIWNNGVEGREVSMMLADKYYCVVQVYLRGNRTYLLLKQNMTENSTGVNKDDFFSSFALTPYQQPDFYSYEPEGDNFKVKLVSAPTIRPDTVVDYASYLKNGMIVISSNPNSGGVYTFDYYQVSKYYRTTSVDSLYTRTIKSLVSYKDSLVRIDTITLDGKNAREYIVQNKASHQKMRRRVLVDNGYVYFLSGYVAPDELNSPASDTFFNSFTITHPKPAFDIGSSKAVIIGQDLSSVDTSIFNSAKGALSYYKFTSAELPVIYGALQKNYRDDTTEDGAKHQLVGVLEKVHDGQSSKVLQDLFTKQGTKDELKGTILETLPAVDKKDGYDTYLKWLIESAPLKIKSDYSLFYPLTDSLDYAAGHFKNILPLLSYTEYRKDVLGISRSMLYSSKKEDYLPLLKTNFNELTKYAEADLKSYLADKDSIDNPWGTNIYKYLQLMTEVKGESLTNNFTQQLITKDPKGAEIPEAAIARIKNHLPVDQKVLNGIMDSINTRSNLMEALYKENLPAKIPLKYKKQDEFAKLCLYQYAEDDDDHPDKITLLGTVADKGWIYYAFKFTLPNRDDNKNYIGIAGPFKPGSNKLYFDGKHAYTDWDTKKANWQLQAKKLIPKLKKEAVSSQIPN